MSSAAVTWWLATSALLVACGSRTGIDPTPARAHSSVDASAPVDAFVPVDAAAPLDASRPPFDARQVDAPLGDAGACIPAPPGGIVISGFPDSAVLSVGLAVAASTVYAGVSSLVGTSALQTGVIERVASIGGPMQPLPAPAYNFGNLASDGARVYYPESQGTPQGPNSAIYTLLGVAAIDLVTGAVHPIASTTPPWSTSSLDTTYMLAATPGTPGVFWIGGSTGSGRANTLSAWNPATDAVTVIATGQALSGLAVDDTGVYWADVGGGITVYRSAPGGGAPITLANVPGGTHGALLGVSSNDVVFVPDYMTGVIDVVSKSGGAARALAKASASWVNAAAWVDETYLYWTENATQTILSRVAVAGGATEVVPTQGVIQTMAFDACNVYIATTNPVEVLVRPK